jgi:hypothetical protein
MYESEIQIKSSDSLNKVKSLEENHSRAMFDLRQLLNMQQRMSNKYEVISVISIISQIGLFVQK